MVHNRHIAHILKRHARKVMYGTAAHLRLARVLAVWAVLGVSVALAGCDLELPQDPASQEEPPAAASVPTAPVASTSPFADSPGGANEAPTAVPAPGQAGSGEGGAPPVLIDYTVQEGDTLSGIAMQFDTTVEALMEANDLTSAHIIYVGQALKVPASNAAAQSQGASQPEGAAGAAGASNPTTVPQQEPPQAAQPTPAPALPATVPTPVVVNGRTYAAYNWAAIKKGQWYHYTCEFDAAWVVLKSYGFDVGLEEQVQIVGLDTSIEPYYEETADGIVIYGGDVTTAYSGDYKKNFLARSSGQAMRKLFEHFGLGATPVRDRESLEAALLRGELVWIKTTVDFKPWREATWIMPDGRSYKTVLGNDHALVIMGFNEDGVVVRDPLGPTSTNWNRKYEYEVPWARFMASWGAQEFDGLAVAPPNG